MKSICFIFNKAPYGNNSGRELLDICLMASAFELPITVIFKDAGIYQLMENQNPDLLGLKNHSLTFKALELYGIDEVLVEEESLQKYQIKTKQLLEVARLANNSEIKQKITASDYVMAL